jgi:hypothetical protein
MDNYHLPQELGRVTTPTGVVYRLFDDSHWEVEHSGRRLSGAEESITMFSVDFHDVPAYLGQQRLRDLAARTKGTLAWHEQGSPGGAEV